MLFIELLYYLFRNSISFYSVSIGLLFYCMGNESSQIPKDLLKLSSLLKNEKRLGYSPTIEVSDLYPGRQAALRISV